MDFIEMSTSAVDNIEKRLREKITLSNVELMQIVNQILSKLLQIAMLKAEKLGNFVREEFDKLLRGALNNQETINSKFFENGPSIDLQSEIFGLADEIKSINSVGDEANYKELKDLNTKIEENIKDLETRAIDNKDSPSVSSIPIDTNGLNTEDENIMLNSLKKNRKADSKTKQDPLLECEQCNYSTTQKHSLLRHIKSVHDKIRDFLCDFCEYASSQQGDLNRHTKAKHPPTNQRVASQILKLLNKVNKDPETCTDKINDSTPISRFSFDTYDYRMGDNLSNNNGESNSKPKQDPLFQCEQCNYSTKEKYALYLHIKAVHDKIRDYICEQCEYASTHKFDLKRHIEAKHPSPSIKKEKQRRRMERIRERRRRRRELKELEKGGEEEEMKESTSKLM